METVLEPGSDPESTCGIQVAHGLVGGRALGGTAGQVDVAREERVADVVYVGRERAGILGQRVEGAPDLVVEVLSPEVGI